jgi:hypothetical protein
MPEAKLKPRAVGLRPRCLFCNKELRPNYGYDVPRPIFCGEDSHERTAQFNREHKIFKGTYGGYGDNLFCGLNCGFYWARSHAKRGGK